MLRLEHVSAGYERGKPVLKDLSLTIGDGEAVGLIGANGAGKSTLMKVLLGLLPYEGAAYVDELKIEDRTVDEVRRRLGFVLQNSDHQMFMPTVWEDVLFGPLNYGMDRREAERRGEEALGALGILELKGRHNHRLSGGEKRMAAIASVLVMEPEALLMDEPTASLDPWNRRMVIRAINNQKRTRLIASHDLDMILDTCQRVLLLSGGALAADGEAGRVLRDRALLESHRLELPLRFG